MIYEGSCDTEDWSNDAENSALHHRNKLYFKLHSNRKLFQIVIILPYQIHAALVNISFIRLNIRLLSGKNILNGSVTVILSVLPGVQ